MPPEVGPPTTSTCRSGKSLLNHLATLSPAWLNTLVSLLHNGGVTHLISTSNHSV